MGNVAFGGGGAKDRGSSCHLDVSQIHMSSALEHALGQSVIAVDLRYTVNTFLLHLPARINVSR